MRQPLFVFGTLRLRKYRKAAFGRVMDGAQDTLRGYRRSWIWLYGEKYPVLRPCRGCEVSGLLLMITPVELARADKYEEVYRRHRVTLQSGIKAWVYLYPFTGKETGGE